jgi:hypothetical protein
VASAPASPAAPASSAALADLRGRLDRVRAAAPAAHVEEATGREPLDALVGLTRAQIQAALGAPHTCERDVARDATGQPQPVAPCRTHGDWFYSFYHLPENWNGGGPELLLTFDARGACERAAWRFTQ